MTLPEIFSNILKNIKDNDTGILKIVVFKKKGIGFYHSIVQKKLIHINKQSEFHLLPLKKDDRGRFFILTVGLAGSSEVIMVPREDFDILEYN